MRSGFGREPGGGGQKEKTEPSPGGEEKKIRISESASTEVLDFDAPSSPGVSQVDEKSEQKSAPKHAWEGARTCSRYSQSDSKDGKNVKISWVLGQGGDP